MDEHGIEPKRDAGPRVSRRTFALGAVGACAVHFMSRGRKKTCY